jgi:uncharacterized protein (TIGR02284 family)
VVGFTFFPLADPDVSPVLELCAKAEPLANSAATAATRKYDFICGPPFVFTGRLTLREQFGCRLNRQRVWLQSIRFNALVGSARLLHGRNVARERVFKGEMLRGSMEDSEVVETLLDLLKTVGDAEDGFSICAARARTIDVKEALERAASGSGQRRAVLEATIRGLGGEPSAPAPRGDERVRAWNDVAASIAGKDDDAILGECERGEFVAEHIFREALEKALPLRPKKLVEMLYQEIGEEHARIRALRKCE